MSRAQKVITLILSVVALVSVIAASIVIIGHQKVDEPIVEIEPKLDCPMVDGSVTYGGETDKTALEILATICEIETRDSTDGTIITVTAIDGITTIAPDYWAFYINNAYALSSPNQVQTTETDIIRWQLESIGN